LGRCVEAISVLSIAEGLDRNQPMIYVNKGKQWLYKLACAYIHLKKFNDAISECDKCI
jgi:hypothetical protein